MNVLCASTLVVLCISITLTESRYPYDDTYRPGDIVPHGNERRDRDGRYPISGTRGGYPATGNRGGYPATGNRGGYPATGNRGGYPATGIRGGYPLPGNRGYPIPGILGGGLKRDRPYDDYRPYDSNRRRRTYLPPRGLRGNKRGYDNYDYDYGRYRKQSRNRGPGFYSNDDFNSYGDYSD